MQKPEQKDTIPGRPHSGYRIRAPAIPVDNERCEISGVQKTVPKDHIPGSSYIGSGGCPKLTHGLRSFEFKRVSKKTSSLEDSLSSTESGLQQYPWTTEDTQRFECRRPCQLKTSSLADPLSAIESRLLQIRRGLRYEMCHSLNRTRPKAPVQNQQTSSIQFKVELMPRSEMPICAPPRLS